MKYLLNPMFILYNHLLGLNINYFSIKYILIFCTRFFTISFQVLITRITNLGGTLTKSGASTISILYLLAWHTNLTIPSITLKYFMMHTIDAFCSCILLTRLLPLRTYQRINCQHLVIYCLNIT
jgi:hypothetical protein